MSSSKRSMCLNCDGTNREPQGFHFLYHNLLDFAVMGVSDKTCIDFNRAGQGHRTPM